MSACTSSGDPDLWFSDIPRDIALAKRICGDCPARFSCLDGAAARGERFGVWGGVDLTWGRSGLGAVRRSEAQRRRWAKKKEAAA